MTALLISSGQGPGECRQAVAHVLARLRAEAEALGLDADVTERPAPHGPSSAIVLLSGPAEDLAARWEGVILWRAQSTLRPRHRRKNWFVQVFRLPDPPEPAQIDPGEVEMQATRAGGPGGQHQNKTSSAIHARWCAPEGRVYAVTVRECRSQHQNRKTALERLATLVAQDRAEAAEAQKAGARQLHHQLQRGNPRRIFVGQAFREGS